MGNYIGLADKFANTAVAAQETGDFVTLEDVQNGISEEWERRLSRKKAEDIYTRVTFLMENDLKERLDKLVNSKQKKHGYKTMFLNMALRSLLDRYDV